MTLRERDTCAQIRVPCADVPARLVELCAMRITFRELMDVYPVVTTGEDKLPSAAAAAAAGGGGGAAPPAPPAAATVVEGADRPSGHFSRPAVAIL